MSYAAPFSLLSLHQPDRDDPADERLTWPLAGSLVIHAFVFIAFLSLRFASSFEQSSGSYEVTLVTLPEIATSPAVSPENKSKRNARKVPSPKAQARQAVSPPRQAVRTTSPRPQARAPKQVADTLVNEPKLQVPAMPPKAVTPPPPVSTDPKPILKQNAVKLPPPLQADDGEVPKPELVTDSLMGALDSVVVPKPQTPVLSQEAEPIPAPSPAPVKQSPALEMNVQPVQAPPKPPKLVVGKSETLTPTPRAELLTKKLKQRVDTIVVPHKPEQASSHVSPTVKSDIEQKPDTPGTPVSPSITLPRRAPPLAAVAPPEASKKETPPQTARKNSTVESLTRAIESVRIPEKISKSKTPKPVSAAPLIPEASPISPKAAEARNRPEKKIVLPPSAPDLTKMPVEQPPAASLPAVSKTMPESDTLENQIAEIFIPEFLEAPKPVSKQTESGTEAMPGLLLAPSCSNADWEDKVQKKIYGIHKKIYRYTHRVESPAILVFRVERNGQVTEPSVVRSSGNEKFDLAAKRAVLAAVPLPPFPANMTKPFCRVQHTFTDQRNR